MTLKKCKKCGISKDVTKFYRNRRAKDGREYRCKPCSDQLTKEKRKNNVRKNARPADVDGMRICSKCRVLKDRTEFYRCKATKDGLHNNCKACSIAVAKQWAKENSERAAAKDRLWKLNNPDKVKITQAKWYRANKHVSVAINSKRRLAVRQQCPAWANKKLITEIYAEATKLSTETNIKHVVDHIIPLRGKFVSGLHVETNLQVMTALANNKKYNKMPEDIECS